MPKPYFYNKTQILAEILRVNHAGEYGAVRIYKGQIASIPSPILHHMLDQEKQHLSYFDYQIQNHHSRPTIFLPLWHVGGYLMGKISAMISPKTAMLCTEAVEEVIDDHYQGQRQILHDIGAHNLAKKVEQFRLEELEHKDTAIANGSGDASGYSFVKGMISKVCKIAIWMSKAA